MALSSRHRGYLSKVERKMNEHCGKQARRYAKRGIDQHK